MAARRHVYYCGTVQGVGFRYAVRRLARARDVAGFVRNLPDGDVEVVVEGSEEEVLGLLGEVEAEMRAYIRVARVIEEPPSGEFQGFGVVF